MRHNHGRESFQKVVFLVIMSGVLPCVQRFERIQLKTFATLEQYNVNKQPKWTTEDFKDDWALETLFKFFSQNLPLWTNLKFQEN